jgi:hypothetical protein
MATFHLQTVTVTVDMLDADMSHCCCFLLQPAAPAAVPLPQPAPVGMPAPPPAAALPPWQMMPPAAPAAVGGFYPPSMPPMPYPMPGAGACCSLHDLHGLQC